MTYPGNARITERLGHRDHGDGGVEGRITVQYQEVNPAKIDAYHAAIARELDALDDGNH